MARARKSAAKSSTKSRATSSFRCPECGKTFGRAAALGAHRRRAHGVAGTSTQARASAKRRATASGRSPAIDRDALLQALFPNGVPAREEVIRSVNGWLDEAERLAAL